MQKQNHSDVLHNIMWAQNVMRRYSISSTGALENKGNLRKLLHKSLVAEEKPRITGAGTGSHTRRQNAYLTWGQ